MDAKIDFPWFLIGFILMSLFGSYVLGNRSFLSGNNGWGFDRHNFSHDFSHGRTGIECQLA